jgi:uncharacterized protein YdiU (UPF0061 family)
MLQDTFTKELPQDPILENTRRQVEKACYSFVSPKKTSNPVLLHVAVNMANTLGLSKDFTASEEFLKIVTGNKIVENSKPYAMCYGGHQFGNWAGQLGDGRAINLGEIVHNEKRWFLQLKGAGETPYSRTADGLAVLRSSIREYLCSEAMFYLGVPTTRALSLALTGDQVLRDVLYNGNQAFEKGAIVTRVAPSFLRFGNFEIFSAREDVKTLKTIVNYTLKYFYPHLEQNKKASYIQFFKEVAERTLNMIIHWQRVGFVHGVMNTDNLSILGLTIDYGPYGWLEGYDPGWTPNTTDRQHKRYRYGNQGNIGLWNLYQLANALYPLVEETGPLEAVLENYKNDFAVQYFDMMKSKVGLFSQDKQDAQLLEQLETTLQSTETDMTIFFRLLNSVSKDDDVAAAIVKIDFAFYTLEDLEGDILLKWENWFTSYLKRLQKESLSDAARAEKMNAINPKYVLRNYMAQLAIDKADKGDYALIDELYTLLKNPYSEQASSEKWFVKRPEWARHKVGCSMLSCSS